MKISAYHKKLGHDVSLLLSWDDTENYDRVFVSKVFSETPVPDGIADLPHVECGGTGFFGKKAPPLPAAIEHIMPDYHLYDDFVTGLLESGVNRTSLKYFLDFSIGYTTRGCIRGCSFCVNEDSRASVLHSPVDEFIDPERKYICLLDDNILACKDWRSIFDQLNATGKRFQYKQGMDERLLTDEKCEVIFGSNWIGDYIFAFDNIKDLRLVERKLQLMRKHTHKQPKFYVFCAYNHEKPGEYSNEFWVSDIRDLFERVKILISYQAKPYVMRYEDYKQSPYHGMYNTIASWCNQPQFLTKLSFRKYCELGYTLNRRSLKRYLTEFERQNPEIAAEYFDMKWSDFNE